MDKHATEYTSETIGLEERSRIKIELSTNAKGEVNVSATVEAYAGLTSEGAEEIMARAEALATSAIQLAARAKYDYLDRLYVEEAEATLRRIKRERDLLEQVKDLERQRLEQLSAEMPPAVEGEDTSYANGDRAEIAPFGSLENVLEAFPTIGRNEIETEPISAATRERIDADYVYGTEPTPGFYVTEDETLELAADEPDLAPTNARDEMGNTPQTADY